MDDTDAAETKTAGPPGLLPLWFGLRRPVGRRTYIASGFSLMAVKFALERTIIYDATGRLLSPLQFVSPFMKARAELLRGAPEITAWLIAALTLPFLWIAVSMSVRRAASAGLSAWNGLLVLVPGLNIVALLMLAALPEQASIPGVGPRGPTIPAGQGARVLGVLTGLAGGFLVLLVSVQVLGTYGLVLFVGLPVVMGAVSVVVASRYGTLTLREAARQGALVALVSGLALVVCALEGMMCVAMALPLAVPLGMLGGAIGKFIADAGPRRSSAVAAVLVLPLAAGLEAAGARVAGPAPLHEVLTTVEIDAPPERVWPEVIAFPELGPPDAWFFRHGIAYPIGARIEGSGVGAVRRCEFSTGAFVEPITAWEPPVRLAFDVAGQPPPMVEWSPWGTIDAPHLHDYLRSRRGEFRLVALPGGRTRLEGRTFYELDMAPLPYWLLWSDALIHRIHVRVLDHIKARAEAR